MKDKRCIFKVTLIFLIFTGLLCITGCSGSGNNYSLDNSTVLSEAVGTYIGKDGCVYSLYQDGTAEYYFEENDELLKNQKWGYLSDDDMILIRFSAGTWVFFNADDLSVSSKHNFRGRGWGWTDEAYIKISDEAEHLTKDECRALLNEQLPTLFFDTVAKKDTGKDKQSTSKASQGSKIAESAEAIGDVVGQLYESYEEIYKEYSMKLKTEYEKSQKELDSAIASGSDINSLAEKAAELTNNLAEISAEGTNKMAEINAKNPLNTDDYMKWGTKLNEEYISYGTLLQQSYINSATESITKQFENMQITY